MPFTAPRSEPEDEESTPSVQKKFKRRESLTTQEQSTTFTDKDMLWPSNPDVTVSEKLDGIATIPYRSPPGPSELSSDASSSELREGISQDLVPAKIARNAQSFTSIPSLADLHRGLGNRSPSPEYSRALKKLESRARDQLFQDYAGSGAYYGPATSAKSSTEATLSRPTLLEPSYTQASGLDERRNASDTNPTVLSPSVLFVKVLYDFDAYDQTQLSLKQGDIIRVLLRDASGWYDGYLKGRRGWFPGTYCETYDPSMKGPRGESEAEESGTYNDNLSETTSDDKSTYSDLELSTRSDSLVSDADSSHDRSQSMGFLSGALSSESPPNFTAPKEHDALLAEDRDTGIPHFEHIAHDTEAVFSPPQNYIFTADGSSIHPPHTSSTLAKTLLTRPFAHPAQSAVIPFDGRPEELLITSKSPFDDDPSLWRLTDAEVRQALERARDAIYQDDDQRHNDTKSRYNEAITKLNTVERQFPFSGVLSNLRFACAKRFEELAHPKNLDMTGDVYWHDECYVSLLQAYRALSSHNLGKTQGSSFPNVPETLTREEIQHVPSEATIEATIEDPDDDIRSETASLQSIFSQPSIASSQTSAASFGHVELFDACLNAFADHERFSNLCRALVSITQAARFEQLLNKMLQFHARQLRHIAADALEDRVVRYFAARVSLAAQRLTAIFFRTHVKRLQDHEASTHRILDGNKAINYSQSMSDELAQDCVKSVHEVAGTDENLIEKGGLEDDLRYLPFEQVQNFVMSPDALCDSLDKLEIYVDRRQKEHSSRLDVCSSCNTQLDLSVSGTLHHCKIENQWICLLAPCSESKSHFTDRQTLIAHQKRDHKLTDVVYMCNTQSCTSAEYIIWPDSKSFVAHLCYIHPHDNCESFKEASTFHTWENTAELETSIEGLKLNEHYMIEQCRPKMRDHSLITLAMSHARNFIDDIKKTAPDPNKERACGRRVADDYTELNEGGLNELRLCLRRMERRRASSVPVTYNDGMSRQDTSQYGHVTMFINYVISFVYNPANPGSSPLPQHHGQSNSAQAARQPFQRPGSSNNHLVLVVPHAKRACRVDQPCSDWILSDRGFFEALSNQYRAARGALRSRLSWKSLVSMRFVKFDMLRSGLAQVQKIDDIPPPYLDEYHYEPVNWTPPIGPELLLHLMEHPVQAEPDQVLFKWVPKKLREKLQASPVSGHCNGWGIQYIEDVDRERVCAVLFLCAVASIALGITWTVCKQDVQGGFTIAGTMFVIMATGIGSAETLFGGTTAPKSGTNWRSWLGDAVLRRDFSASQPGLNEEQLKKYKRSGAAKQTQPRDAHDTQSQGPAAIAAGPKPLARSAIHQPIRPVAWKALLKSKSLGEPTSVLVLRDAEGGQVKLDAQEVATKFHPQGVSPAQLMESIQSSKRAPGQAEVNDAIDELKPARSGREPDGPFLISQETFDDLMRSLNEKFNQLQLSRYVTIGAGSQAIQARDEFRAVKAATKRKRKESTKVDKKKMSNSAHIREKWPWVPTDHNSLPLPYAKRRPTFKGKQGVIDDLLRRVWGIEVIEEVYRSGVMALDIERNRLAIISDRSSPKSLLQNLSQQNNVSISMDMDSHALIIVGDKYACTAATNSVREYLANYIGIKLHLQLLMTSEKGGRGFNGSLRIADAYRIAKQFQCRLTEDEVNIKQQRRRKKAFANKDDYKTWTLHTFDYERARACVRAIVRAAGGRTGQWQFLFNVEKSEEPECPQRLTLAGSLQDRLGNGSNVGSSRYVTPFRLARGDTPTMLRPDYNVLDKSNLNEAANALQKGFDPGSVLKPEECNGLSVHSASFGQVRWLPPDLPLSAVPNQSTIDTLNDRRKDAYFDPSSPGLVHLFNNLSDVVSKQPLSSTSELQVTLVQHPLTFQALSNDQFSPILHLTFQPHPQERLLRHKETRLLLDSPVVSATNVLCPGLATDLQLTHQRSLRFALPPGRETKRMGREMKDFIRAIETSGAGYGRVTAPADPVVWVPYWRKESKPVSLTDHPTRYAGMKMFDRRMFTQSIEFVQEIRWSLPESSGVSVDEDGFGPQLVYKRISAGEESGVSAKERLEVQYVSPFRERTMPEDKREAFLSSINTILVGLNKGLGRMAMKSVGASDAAAPQTLDNPLEAQDALEMSETEGFLAQAEA
ncbi:MAG: hypothetical protein Q9159_003581 [Coniocarpon cinnabarinum]